MLVSSFDYFSLDYRYCKHSKKAYCNLGERILCVDMHAWAVSSVFSVVPLSECCRWLMFVLIWSDGEVEIHSH